jgi:iron-sulfur cluster repair protein YtfE (RIC family)
MEPAAARQTLLEQHERIRGHLNDCSALARRIRDGEPVQAALDATLDTLRRDFADHNLFETGMLRPLLRGSTAWGKLLIDRMLEEHVAEEAAELQVEDERPFEPRVAGELYTGNVGSFVRVKQA